MSETCWTVGDNGVSLRVKARPGAGRDAILGVRGGELVVAVRAAAEKGRANKEVARVLSKALGISMREIALKTGRGSHHKVFHLCAGAPRDRFPLDALQSLAGRENGS